MKVIITGGTGFIGAALTKKLIKIGEHPWIISRGGKSVPGAQFVPLDSQGLLPEELLSKTQVIINLAGESVGQYWHKDVKERILNSRLSITNNLVNSLARNQALGLSYPRLLISASAIGYYGTTAQWVQTETSPSGTGFLASVCRQWEEASLRAQTNGVRVVIFRFGHVLGPGGGVLQGMSLPFRWGVGGNIGSGQQFISWIHLDDLLQLLLLPIQNEQMNGIYNATTTQPVTMKAFMQELGKALDRPSWTNLPAWAARLFMGEMAKELLLPSQQVLPERLTKLGYSFLFPKLSSALQNIYQK